MNVRLNVRIRRDPLDQLALICKQHQIDNEQIHRSALRLLELGQPLNEVVEFCRLSYRKAHEKHWQEDSKVNGL